MKKIILISLSLITTLSVSAQIKIHRGADLTDISGTTIYISIDPNIVNENGDSFWYEPFTVTNNTGADGVWSITRKKVSAPATWTDDVCWPPSCYTINSATYPVLFTTPHNPGGYAPAPTITNGTSYAVVLNDPINYFAEIKPQVHPDFANSGSATYTYYVTDADAGTYLDSITIVLDYTLAVGVEENKIATALNISPNPASEFVSINIEGSQTSNVKIVDVLGNIVYTKQVNAATKISVSDLRNGVYFVSIEGENKKTITKKLVVKH